MLTLLLTSAGVLSRRAVVLSGIPLSTAASSASASQRSDLVGAGSSERCESGDGEACERLSEGNPYIQKLQARSRENREKNAAKVWDQTVKTMDYDSYFSTLDQNMVLLPDGAYKLLSADEYSRLRQAGKLKVGAIDRVLEE